MSEQRLRDLGREAEELVGLPDLGSLERRGRALRFRRQVGVVAAAAVIATTGVWLFQDRVPQEPQPAPPRTGSTNPYPGPQMENLAPGTYELTPSADGTDPTAIITVPKRWNSWVGPNRFNGHLPGGSNDEALARSTWIVGALVLKVLDVATEPCQATIDASGGELGYAETVDAISELPGYRAWTVRSQYDDRFAHPATHLRLVPDAAQQSCYPDFVLFATEANGPIGARGTLDVWVVDVDGVVMTVVTYEHGDVPEKYRDELSGVANSIAFVPSA